MATLTFSQIRAHPGGTIAYIADKSKIISDQAYDVYRVLNYMGDEKSVTRVYTLSRHCSPNPAVAEKEIELHRQRYYVNKKGARPHEGELLGIHFFMSYTQQDNPSVDVMNTIALALAEHPLLRDFATFSANHFDKPQRHTHTYVSQFSAVGKPRKMGLHFADLDELKRYTNRLCVEHGLSIIDTKALRADQEYSAWVDAVIAEGKVVVHPEKNEPKKKRRKNTPAQNYYYKWKKQGEERVEEEIQMLTKTQRNRKKFEETYFYNTDGNMDSFWYVSGDSQKRFYVVPLTSNEGYRRSLLELTVRFVLRVANCESGYIKHKDPETWLKYHAKIDKKLQGMYDYMMTANQMNVKTPGQISKRLADIGKQMNALRCEKAKHEKSIEKHEQIIEAYEMYTRIRCLVEGAQEPNPKTVSQYKAAYAILAQNQILSAEVYARLCRRYDFEKQKIVDYARRLPELNRQYHELKKLQVLAVHATDYLREIYSYSDIAYRRVVAHNDGDVDSIIDNARLRSRGNTVSDNPEKEY